ncbi:hypothetical protein ACVI1J_009166 [Bradyrhizobium diazoefficiens]
MSSEWYPISPPIIEGRDEADQKDDHAFAGTHMVFHVKQGYLKYFEVRRDELPFGVKGPPIPTGATDWRRTGVRVRISADIHMTPDAVNSMRDNEQKFADLMATFTAGTATLFFALGHAIFAYGLANAVNPDGSLDIHIDPTGAKAGGHLILVPPDTCMMIIQVA